MTANPLVSILVNCYNSEAYLRQALDSIYAQSYQNFEVLLVDNCSTDQTAAIAKSYDQRLKYIRTDYTIPLYGARNVGLPHAKGDYLFILDSDDFWKLDKLTKQVQIFEENQKIDILYSAYESLLEAPQTFSLRFKKMYLALINFSDNFLRSQFVNRKDFIKRYNLNFQTTGFRMKALTGMKFDSKLNLIGDVDFIFRLIWEKNCQIYYMHTVTAVSRIHQKQLSRKSDLRWVIESLKLYKKMKKFMTEDERHLYYKYFVKFYFSSHLLRKKKFSQALLLKSQFILTSIRMFIHFSKSFLLALKG